MADDEKPKRPKPAPFAIIDGGLALTPTPAPREEGGGGTGSPGSPPVWASDDFLAHELVKKLGEDWCCAMPGEEWHHWSGQRWEGDDKHVIFDRARAVCRAVAVDIEKHSLAKAVSSKTTIYAAAKIAATDPRVTVAHADFDGNDWILNTPTGVVDLRSGQKRLAARDDYCARMTRAAPEGDCPSFYSFLLEATGKDQALIAFVQRVFGYCLTGATIEHAIFFLEGPGGTGKTILLNILQWLLGDYATPAPMDIFTVSTGERHPADLALLHNARLVTASETEEGRRWDEAKLKAITGGDPITARRIRQDFFTFVPKFKLFMAGNYRPAMRSADDAMRRRMHIIPWKVKPLAPDKRLFEKLQAEAGGILKWAIEGAAIWQARGLMTPDVVSRATDEYFAAENVIGRWIAERCSTEKTVTASTKSLYRDFQSWAKGAGEFVPSERRFAQRIERAGFERWRNEIERGFRGVAPLVRQDELLWSAPPQPRAGGGETAQRSLDDADEWEARGPRE